MTAPIRITPEYEIYRVIAAPSGNEPADISYETLLEGFYDRVEDLNTPRVEIDEAGDFASGHSAAILAGNKMLGKTSLGKMLKATGLALVLVVDDARFAAVKARLVKRRRTVKPAIAGIVKPAWLFTKDKAREMGKKRWSGVSDLKRKRLAKRAAKARWRKARKTTAAPAPSPIASPDIPPAHPANPWPNGAQSGAIGRPNEPLPIVSQARV